MATDKLTPEDIKLANDLNALLADRSKSVKDILDTHKEYAAELEKSLGQQQSFATEIEKRQILEAKALEVQQALLDSQTRLNTLQELKTRGVELEKEQAKELEKLEAKIEKYDDAAIKAQQDLIKELEKRKKETDKIVELQDAGEARTKQQLQEMFGLTNQTEDFADILIDAGGNAKAMTAALDGAGKAMGEMMTVGNVLKTAKNFMKDFTDAAYQNITATDGLLMRFQQLDKEFAQSTGLSQELGAEIKDLTTSMNDQFFSMEETARAFETLSMRSQAFTEFSTQQRRELSEQALQLTRLGVSADTFAESVDSLNKVFGQTPGEINATTEEMAKFGRALGIGPNKMMEEFNKNVGVFAKYGRDKATKMLEELAVTAKRTGLEMNDLLGVAAQFDTFEGAAEAAGKLNFMLGGPLLNSVELLNATEEDRIKMLRESVKASGKTFEAMGRFEKELVAQTLGVGVDVAQKLFSDDNISSIEEATAAVKRQAGEQASLNEQAEDAATLAQREKAAQEALLKTAKAVGPIMEYINEVIISIKSTLGEFAPLLLPVIFAFKGLVGVMGLLRMRSQAAMAANVTEHVTKMSQIAQESAARAAGATAAGAANAVTTASGVASATTVGAANVASQTATQAALAKTGIMAKLTGLKMSAAFGIFGVAIVAIIGALGYLMANWDDLGEGVMETMTMLGDGIAAVFNGIINALKAILKGVMTLIVSGTELFIQAMFSPISALVEGAAGVLSYIPGMGDMADGLRGFSPARIINDYGSQLRAGIDSFADGGTNIPGGPAIVGERGPELVTLPKGSNVVTNENVNRMMGNQQSAAPQRSPKEQTLNITLKLDNDVLARHTEKITWNAMTDAFQFTRGRTG